MTDDACRSWARGTFALMLSAAIAVPAFGLGAVRAQAEDSGLSDGVSVIEVTSGEMADAGLDGSPFGHHKDKHDKDKHHKKDKHKKDDKQGEADDQQADDQQGADDAAAAPTKQVHYLAANGAVTEAPECTDLAEALKADILDGGWYYLSSDATLDHVATIKGNVSIVLDNATIGFAEGACLCVPDLSKLRIYVAAGEDGTAASGTLAGAGAYSLIMAERGRVEVVGATLTGAAGHGVELSTVSSFTLVRGSVEGCGGSGIHADSDSAICLLGGRIALNGGFGTEGGYLKVSGAPVVRDNAQGNVKSGSMIELAGKLEEGANIGVERDCGKVFTVNYSVYNTGFDPGNYFFSSNGWRAAVMSGEVGFTKDLITYVDENGKPQTLLESCVDISDPSFEDKEGYGLQDGCYILRNSREFEHRMTITGNATLILCDGATANFTSGIRGYSGRLTIYAQSNGGNMGKLIATGCEESAGIGGNNDEDNKTDIWICGGEIEATGDDYAAGIGGGDHGGCGNIKILGGHVTATGDGNYRIGGGAGIGSGDGAKTGGAVDVRGGNVTATGGYYGAGIGTGDEAKKTVTVSISGGVVTAAGGYQAAGIGGGNEVSGGTISISGGTVNATGKTDGAGIGGGDHGNGGKITISGGNVNAKSGSSGAAIGGGMCGSGGEITISGGNVHADSSSSCSIHSAAIGGGSSMGDSGTITITGGTIEAESAWQGNATNWTIGCGSNGKINQIVIPDGYVVTNVDTGNRVTGSDRMNALKDWDHLKLTPAA